MTTHSIFEMFIEVDDFWWKTIEDTGGSIDGSKRNRMVKSLRKRRRLENSSAKENWERIGKRWVVSGQERKGIFQLTE